MKKRDLLFAGMLLMGVTAIAQPVRTAQDAKVIFTQTFEDDWDKWQSTPVDTIYQLEYFKGISGGNQAFSNAWTDAKFKDDNIVVRTDSVTPGKEGGIIIYNGVMLTDDKADITNQKYRNDEYAIVTEQTPERAAAFDQWGEDGGEKAFRFISAGRYNADGTSAVGSSDNKYTDDYRRNLFVRLKNVIEPETSYRMTFYVKAKSTTASSGYSPRLHTALFRGYFHSEKPFTMGLQDDNDHNLYKTEIVYEKTDFTGKWEKVTYMDYYLNDSIADYYMLSSGYWWSDSWVWTAAENGTEEDLKFIKQPDKFFFRMSFRSDSTDFMVDNISLTKSWIAGCEYDKDKMRVDFGYKTNLGKLVEDAYKETRIDAIEVPGDSLEVWCLVQGGDPEDPNAWEDMPIRSAEYHSDGYMYIFTDFFTLGGEEVPFEFDNYDQVLVSFRNPVDNPKLALKYTGTGKSAAELFPKALDTTWIKNGKIVPDFYNELATPNPNIFTGVHSMKDLPPVLQELPYEEGSFALDPVTSFEFKFSRKVLFDNLENTAKAIAYVNGKRWNMAYGSNDSIIVISAPAGTPTLSGDCEIELIQLYGVGTDEGKEVKLTYNFGALSRVFNVEPVYKTNWAAAENSGTEPIPLGTAIMDDASKDFTLGDGVTKGKGSRLYKYSDEGQYNRGFYVCPRGSNVDGRMFVGVGDDDTYYIRLKKGDYQVSFFALGWDGVAETELYVYPRTVGTTPDKLDAANKTKIGTFTPEKYIPNSDGKNTSYKISTASSYSFKFRADADTAYVFEFVVLKKAGWNGDLISDLTITEPLPVSYPSINALNQSVIAAQARIAAADADKTLYTGSIYDVLVEKTAYYQIGGAFDAAKKTKPTEWAAAKSDLDKATDKLKTRMDSVGKFVDQKKAVVDKLAATETNYSGLALYQALAGVKAEADAYPVTTKTGAEIYAFNDTMKKAIEALDTRIALNTKFANELSRALQLLEDSAKIGFEEYPALKRVYEANKAYNTITATEDDINATYEIVKGAADAYEYRVMKSQILPRRVKELDALARKLGSTIGDTASIKDALAELEVDDDMLANVYKAAIKLALYEKLADDAQIYTKDSLDLTPFIKNYYLYQTPKVVDRAKSGANSSEAHKADPDGANMQLVNHQWNNVPIYVMIQNIEFTDLYPGWTAVGYTEGNQMTTGDKSYEAYKKGLPVFDAEIGMDWNTKSELWQDLEDLPAGMYSIGAEFPEHKYRPLVTSPSWSAHPACPSVISVTAPDSTYEVKVETDGAQKASVDSIMVGANDTLKVKLTLWSGDGWSRADNFSLSFRQDKDFAYDEAAEGLRDEIAGLLTIVDPAKAVAANVEYYTLGGVQVAAPKSGQILIRKTNVNGKVVVDKVLLK